MGSQEEQGYGAGTGMGADNAAYVADNHILGAVLLFQLLFQVLGMNIVSFWPAKPVSATFFARASKEAFLPRAFPTLTSLP